MFAASGLALDDRTRSAIDDRVRRWRFQIADGDERAALEAVRSAAALLGRGEPVLDTTERTLAALELHDLFLATDADGRRRAVTGPDPESVRVELRRRRGA